MEILLLGIYAAIVYVIFIELKWLPADIGTQVVVVIIPIVALTDLVLTLNVISPSTHDVRVIKYVINIVPQVRGRVTEVPVEPNRLVHKGDILFRIDPTSYELTVRSLEAQLANSVASSHELTEQIAGAAGKVTDSRAAMRQARAQISEVESKLDLARLRVGQPRAREDRRRGKFALERAEADVRELEAQLDAARSMLAQAQAAEVQSMASERQLQQRSEGKFENEYAPVAAIRAQLENAKWDLSQTTVTAPTSGYATTCNCVPGSFTTAFPLMPAMTFVEETYQVIALYEQNELQFTKPGDEAEFTLETYPGRIIKAHVDSIVWAQGQGQVANKPNCRRPGMVLCRLAASR